MATTRRNLVKLYRQSGSKDKFEFLYSEIVGSDEENLPLNVTKDFKSALSKRGRPEKDNFDDLSDISKRRRTVEVREKMPLEALVFATQMSLRKSGQKAAADSLGLSTQIEPPAPLVQPPTSKQQVPSGVTRFSEDEALALLDQADLTKEQYIYIRKCLINHGVDVLPCYDYVRRAKARCYPPESTTVKVTEAEMTISVQSLFDLTAKRFVSANLSLFECCSEVKDFVLMWKWGYDGASAYVEYNQTPETDNLTEGTIILTAAVPLQILAQPANEPEYLLYQNDRPGSPRHCRPIQLQFRKETKPVIKEIHKNVQSQIKNLVPVEITLPNSSSLTIRHKAVLSMIDGKINSTLTDDGNQTCNVCKAVPTMMNKIDFVLARPVERRALQLFISVLHAWIRFLELCLNIAYRITIKHAHTKYSVAQKAEMKLQKAKVKKSLKEGLGIKVDSPKPGGCGNTNDGNLARRFFQDPQKTASLTGLNAALLDRFRVILIVLSTCYVVDIPAFQQYALQTARDYVAAYPWYRMPCTMHKALIHGADIMRIAPVPIGLLSEEPLESRHKNIRHFRKHHTRTCSRTKGNTDLLHCLLVSSDPLLYTLRPKPKPEALKFCPSVLSLLRESSPSGVRGSDLFTSDTEEDDL